MAKVYTIITPPGISEPADYPDLVGLQVIDLGSDQFELVQVLATAEGTGGPPKLPSFSFNNFKDWNWTLTATSKTEGVNRSMSGSWSNTDPNGQLKDEEGTWTASGTGSGAEDDDAKSASAY